MTDRLYLSLWWKDPQPETMLPRMMRLLATFPFSRLMPQVSLTVRAVSPSEAPILEESFVGPNALEQVGESASGFSLADASVEVEGAWDLLIRDGEIWKLSPVGVAISAFGLEYEREGGEDLRIEFGTESPFIPETESPESFRYAQENIRSLLRLMKDLDSSLPVANRRLWSESGENFAGRLASLVQP